MVKRYSALLIALVLLLCASSSSFACDEEQTDTYITQVLFGDDALSRANDENVKKLQDAVYICCEQCDSNGQEKLDYLKTHNVSGVPKLSKIDIDSDNLLECSHNSWEYKYTDSEKIQAARKKVLQKTVNDVFDFGFLNNHFGSNKGKCNSFAALLYYTHILSDYLADEPSQTETVIDGKEIPAYTGEACIEINSNRPSFTKEQKSMTQSFEKYSPLDEFGRAGVAFANIGVDIMPAKGSRSDGTLPDPSGWKQEYYTSMINNGDGHLFDRSHLIAYELTGYDQRTNLITGTDYLNKNKKGYKLCMNRIEDEVEDYIRKTNNHVLYRVTPVYSGQNKVASGIQLEAYSVEDQGKGICYNVYCYNVQPGIKIDYANGDSTNKDVISLSDKAIPFATEDADEANPDLLFEMSKYLEILFEDQNDSSTFSYMKSEIDGIANEARTDIAYCEKEAERFQLLKEKEYRYIEVLRSYVPILLKKEDFFKSAFN